MEMSEILDRAKELATRYEANGYIHRDATLLLPNLVAECEFWQQRAIEERAQRIISMGPEEKFDRYDLQECPKIGYICDENDGYCVLSECPSITFWKQIAAKELGLQEEKIIGGWNHDPISSLV